MRMLQTICALYLLGSFAGAPSLAASASPVEALNEWLAHPRDQRPDPDAQPLNKVQAGKARQLLWDDHVAEVRATRAKEWKDEAITLGEHTLRFKQRQFGTNPKEGWSLYLSLHGGGNAPPQLNDQQWENPARLYQPKEGLYVAPRTIKSLHATLSSRGDPFLVFDAAVTVKLVGQPK